jgi:cytoskeletal protein RodZ
VPEPIPPVAVTASRRPWAWVALAAVPIGIAGVWAFGRMAGPTPAAQIVVAPSPAVLAASTPMAETPLPEPPKLADAPSTAVAKSTREPSPLPVPSREPRLAGKATSPATAKPEPPVVAMVVRPPSATPGPTSTTASAPIVSPPPTPVAAAPVPQPAPRETAAPRSARDEQVDAAEAALRRGDANGAVQILAPLAAAGVSRAQTLLGRAQEARPSGQQNDFEAYVWYGIAARNGQAGAQTQRDRVGAKLQPAEIRQADQIIERWKPRADPAPSPATERTAP